MNYFISRMKKSGIRLETHPDEHRHTILGLASQRRFAEDMYDGATLIFLVLHSSQAIVTFCLFGFGAPEWSTGLWCIEVGVEFASLIFVAHPELIAISD
jgi:hypothetical protein